MHFQNYTEKAVETEKNRSIISVLTYCFQLLDHKNQQTDSLQTEWQWKIFLKLKTFYLTISPYSKVRLFITDDTSQI